MTNTSNSTPQGEISQSTQPDKLFKIQRRESGIWIDVQQYRRLTKSEADQALAGLRVAWRGCSVKHRIRSEFIVRGNV